MTLRRWALATQIALLVYFELVMLVPLGAWNDQPAMRAPFTAVRLFLPAAIGAGQLLLLFATIARIRWLMWIGIVADAAWLTAQVYSLWLPYIFGASEERMRMQRRIFGRTTQWLPSYGNHPAPDAMHIVIQALLLAVLATTIAFALKRDAGRSSDARHQI